METRERFRGALLGLACGDAVGTAVEFRARGSFRPLNDMVGGGPFALEPGQWTDDTSMALCLATSLVECGGFDPRDQMDRYWRWSREGYLSSTGTCFDIGNTVRDALHRYLRTGEPYAGSSDPYAAGNGCIMRLAPVALAFYPDMELVERLCGESSRTTHGATECVDACRLMGRMLCRALDEAALDEVLFAEGDAFVAAPKIAALAGGDYREKPREAIHGTGYVVASLEAALWCLSRTSSFREAILLAANLGDDADTTAAVCGQLAGAHYGCAESEGGIPQAWRDKLTMADEIIWLADQLLDGDVKP